MMRFLIFQPLVRVSGADKRVHHLTPVAIHRSAKKTLTGRLAYVDVRLGAAEAEEGFSLLARALPPVSLQVQRVEIGVKEALLARRVDLRTILESLDSVGPRPGELRIWVDDDHGGMFPVTGGFEAVEHYLEGMGQRMDN